MCEEFIFDETLLRRIHWETKTSYRKKISPQNAGEGFVLRPLALNDFDRGECVIIIIVSISYLAVVSNSNIAVEPLIN